MPIEYLHGLLLEDEDLEMIRAHLEESETIEAIDPEIRGIVARNWPFTFEAAARGIVAHRGTFPRRLD
jgi:hypothetical protein